MTQQPLLDVDQHEHVPRVDDSQYPQPLATASTGAPDAITPEGGWPAQPALTPQQTFVQLVRQDVVTLIGVAASLEDRKQLRRIAVRDEMRRTLAGVIANCETLRLALDKGRA